MKDEIDDTGMEVIFLSTLLYFVHFMLDIFLH